MLRRRFGVALTKVTGINALDGYLVTSPGGIYAVLATVVETRSHFTFVIAAQVIRVLLMLFTAPLWARLFVRPSQISATNEASRAPIRAAD